MENKIEYNDLIVENRKLKGLLHFLIKKFPTSSQYETNETKVFFTVREKQLYSNLVNKRIYRFSRALKLESRRLLNKIKNVNNREKLRQAIIYVETLDRRYRKFLQLKEQKENVDLEYNFLKNYIEGEYKQIKKNIQKKDSLRTGLELSDFFKDIQLDFIIYNIKDTATKEGRYKHLKDVYGSQKTQDFYAKYYPNERII